VTPRCQTCRHFDRTSKRANRHALCRRRAPSRDDGWPAVYADDWCSEHEPTDEHAKTAELAEDKQRVDRLAKRLWGKP
jgi:hypothetical protein